MKTFSITLATIAVSLTGVAPMASAAAPLTRTVNYAALDVSSAAGAEQLYSRLKAAAKQVCAASEGGTLAQKYQNRVCVDTALANAVVRVDQPLVKNIHDAKGASIRVASR